MKSIINGILITTFLTFNISTAMAQGSVKEAALKTWENYFLFIKTLNLDYRMTDSKGNIVSNWPYKTSFYMDGEMFRLENNFKPGGYKTLSIYAFNGKAYQDFGVFSGGGELILSSTNETDLPYSGVPLPLSLFSFSMGRQDVWSFHTMKEEAHWKKLAKGMTYIRSFKVDGKKHCIFKIDIGRGIWQVETEGNTYFPVKISSRVTTNGGDIVIGTTTVISKTTWNAGNHQFYFPLILTSTAEDEYGRTYPPKSKGQRTTVNEKTLRINQPISKSIFTIPKSQAKNVIYMDKVRKAAKKAKEKK